MIEFLKGFTYLRHLDMFNNPLSEEPYYRDRVIYGMPQLQIFDRRSIGYLERVNARKVSLKYKNSRKKKKKKKQKIIKKAFRPSECFSKGEKNLYRDATLTKKLILSETMARDIAEKQAREQLFYQDVDFENPPISQFLAETSV